LHVARFEGLERVVGGIRSLIMDYGVRRGGGVRGFYSERGRGGGRRGFQSLKSKHGQNKNKEIKLAVWTTFQTERLSVIKMAPLLPTPFF